MSEGRRGHALWTLPWRIALAALALGVLAYPVAWNADPWFVDILLVATAVGVFAFVRTISWT